MSRVPLPHLRASRVGAVTAAGTAHAEPVNTANVAAAIFHPAMEDEYIARIIADFACGAVPGHGAAPEPCVPGRTRPRARGPGDCGEFASAHRCVERFPGAASSQPPHMSISQSISRTTSFPVYRRPYSRSVRATRDLSAQRSQTRAASIRAAMSSASGVSTSALPSSVCTRAPSVMLETNQTPWAANRSVGVSAW